MNHQQTRVLLAAGTRTGKTTTRTTPKTRVLFLGLLALSSSPSWFCRFCFAFTTKATTARLGFSSPGLDDSYQSLVTPTCSTRHHYHHRHVFVATKSTKQLHAAAATTTTTSSSVLGPRIAIDEQFSGLERVHTNPDVFILRDFLQVDACRELIKSAKAKKLERSPVAYAGWTQDVLDLTELALKGPVTWLAILGAWYQVNTDDSSGSLSPIVNLVIHGIQNFAVLLVVAVAAIAAFTKSRSDSLQSMRTSTSTTLDDLDGPATRTFCAQAAKLFSSREQNNINSKKEEAKFFEAPTVIRYQEGQVLKPHYDANRSANTEDANRGGQTLATLLVYLNDVPKGGLTRFGKLLSSESPSGSSSAAAEEAALTVQPKCGDALLFFPADANGNFDERLEHEGCPAISEKWIARIWRHQERVPQPFGLADSELDKLEKAT